MPIADKITKYSVSLFQNNFLTYFRQIRLSLESGGDASIQFSPRNVPVRLASVCWVEHIALYDRGSVHRRSIICSRVKARCSLLHSTYSVCR